MLARLRTLRRPLDLLRDRAQEPITERPVRPPVRWNPILVWFMRLVALLWIAGWARNCSQSFRISAWKPV